MPLLPEPIPDAPAEDVVALHPTGDDALASTPDPEAALGDLLVRQAVEVLQRFQDQLRSGRRPVRALLLLQAWATAQRGVWAELLEDRSMDEEEMEMAGPPGGVIRRARRGNVFTTGGAATFAVAAGLDAGHPQMALAGLPPSRPIEEAPPLPSADATRQALGALDVMGRAQRVQALVNARGPARDQGLADVVAWIDRELAELLRDASSTLLPDPPATVRTEVA